MPHLAIDIEHVSKEFIVDGLGDYSRLTEAFVRWVKSLAGEKEVIAEGKHDYHSSRAIGQRKFLALDDVTLQVRCGETLGIVGSNGAGKSTLLKILSRIMSPTQGRFGVRGRIGCLLEVGTGFHPELTGRENVFLNGAILGMPRSEIRKRFDEIVEFAEVGPFLDMPVKRYSNGMLIRLGFSVAAHLDPDVLIVDEVLGVGDAAFQRKSLGKARDFRDQGRTVLMVSHNLPMIASFCSRAVLLKDGKLIADGDPDAVIERHLSSTSASSQALEWRPTSRVGTEYLDLRRVICRSSNGIAIKTDDGVQIEIHFTVRQSRQRVCFQTVLTDEAGISILKGVNSPATNLGQDPLFDHELDCGDYVCTCTIPAHLLNSRRYLVTILVGQEPNRVDRSFDSVLGFEVADASAEIAGTNIPWDGFVVRPKLNWSTRRVD